MTSRPSSAPRKRTWAYVTAGAVTAAAVLALAVPTLAGNRSAEAASATKSAAVNDAAHLKSSSKTAKAAAANDDVGEDGTATPSPTATKKKSARVASANEPIPATESSYAKNIPNYPPDGRHGRRIVYSKALMHVWIVNSDDKVVRHYPVTGRWDRPAKGVYKVYSMSTDTMNEHSKVTFQYMVRFAWGFNDTTASIGFHSIPIYYADNPERDAKKGDRMSSKYELGLPVASGGCVRQADADAEFLYRWAEVGDTVVVLPTAN